MELKIYIKLFITLSRTVIRKGRIQQNIHFYLDAELKHIKKQSSIIYPIQKKKKKKLI